jgi:hypothetical protein
MYMYIYIQALLTSEELANVPFLVLGNKIDLGTEIYVYIYIYIYIYAYICTCMYMYSICTEVYICI